MRRWHPAAVITSAPSLRLASITSHLVLTAIAGVSMLLSGCATAPVDRSGVSGAITVPDTNPEAITRAARPAFARYGYQPARGTTAQSLFFQRPSAPAGGPLLGNPPPGTTLRVRLQLLPLSGGNDYRLLIQVAQADMRSPSGDQTSLRLWMSEFNSVLREIRAQAAHAGPSR